MNSVSVLNPKTHPGFQLGAMGWPDEWGGELIRNTPQTVADSGRVVKDAIGDLLKQDVLASTPEQKDAGQKTQIGGKTELKFDKKEQEIKEKNRVINFQKELTQAQKEEIAKEARRKSIARQREDVIRKIGGITNFSYEDVMDDQGIMRTDIEAWFNKKNSEMQEAELKKQKQTQVKQATGKINYFMQHNMAGERAGGQHVLSAVG